MFKVLMLRGSFVIYSAANANSNSIKKSSPFKSSLEFLLFN
jgi:hypothetical protein